MTPENEHWKLFDGTTAPPWEVCTNKSGNHTIRQVGSSGYLSSWIASPADAAFIVAAVNALPALLARVKRYEAALHEVIGLDHHNMGPESRATKLARAALDQECGG